MKQQTAVEWLIKEIENKNGIEFISYFNELISQAKEMEKEQIINAHLIGLIHPLEMEASKQANQYYNETYGGNQ